ncbi:hypothetical protein TNCV_2932591 [Trichonephila clavipes]|nr:hypothetical protein TNCV_2932591 [Trichonephila clavipes]
MSPMSPDMSPIDYVWDLVNRRLVPDPRPAASKDELLLSIQAIWNSFSSRHSKSKTDCFVFSGGIIGPYFFKNDEGHNVTVNGVGLMSCMITNFHSELSNHDVQAVVPTRSARAFIEKTRDRLISRFGPVNWFVI